MLICQEIISEYDTENQQYLSYSDFKNLVLPAANESLRGFVTEKRNRTPKSKKRSPKKKGANADL